MSRANTVFCLTLREAFERAGMRYPDKNMAPGSLVPDADHVARASVRVLATVAELPRKLGDSVAQGDVVAVIESRDVAEAKSEYRAARVTDEL